MKNSCAKRVVHQCLKNDNDEYLLQHICECFKPSAVSHFNAPNHPCKFVFASKALIMKYILRKANYLKTFFVWLNAFCVQTLCKLTLARSAKLTGSSVVLASDTERMCLLSSLFRAIRDVIAAHQGIQRESIYVLMYLM